MAEVLILLDEQQSHQITAELAEIARQLGTPVGVYAGRALEAEDLEPLGALGFERVEWVRGENGEDLSAFIGRPIASALAQLVSELQPRAVLASSNLQNKEIAAHLGVLTNSGVLTDLSTLAGTDAEITARQVIFAGAWNATSAVSVGTPILLFKPGAVDSEALSGAKVEPAKEITVREVAASGALEGRSARVIERSELPPAQGPDLPSAAAVVVGGRGTEGDFSAVQELADTLGAAVGATRVATDEGWIDHTKQVGQTGVTITPRLYIGAGVSGAVHHLSGMQASEVIVAINSDEDAPLLEIADFGVVGDLHEILPQASAELRRLSEK